VTAKEKNMSRLLSVHLVAVGGSAFTDRSLRHLVTHP
jgi:hypothetical protein